MGKVNLARVDERLIHGQVMMSLTNRSGVNSIFVVDDMVAQDKMMKDLYKSAGNRTGQKTIVLTEEKTKYYWDEYDFKDYSCILLTKSVKTMYGLAKHGVEFEELNLGGVSKKEDSDVQATKAVYMNEEDAKMLKEMNEEYGVSNIYFQTTPSSEKVGLDKVLKKFDLR